MLVHEMLVQPPHAGGWELEPVPLPEGQHGISCTQSGGQEPPVQQDSVQLCCCTRLKTVIPPRWQPAPKSEGQHAISGTQSGGQKPPLQQESGQLYCCTRLQSAGPELVPFPIPYVVFPIPYVLFPIPYVGFDPSQGWGCESQWP